MDPLTHADALIGRSLHDVESLIGAFLPDDCLGIEDKADVNPLLRRQLFGPGPGPGDSPSGFECDTPGQEEEQKKRKKKKKKKGRAGGGGLLQTSPTPL